MFPEIINLCDRRLLSLSGSRIARKRQTSGVELLDWWSLDCSSCLAGFSCYYCNGGDDLCEELWGACAGPLVDVPRQGARVFYFPQGHMEQDIDVYQTGILANLCNVT